MSDLKMAKLPLLLIGGGGHCRSCIEVVESTGLYEIIGIVEADDFVPDEMPSDLLPYPIVGRDSDLPKLLKKTPYCLITIGQIRTGTIRAKVFNQLKQSGAILPTIISPYAYVSATAKIGEGTIVMHQALVNSYAQIGDNCIVNSQSLVEHDCVVANHCHLSTAVKLNGQVHVGEGCLIGSGSIVKQCISIADEVVVGLGSVVVQDIKQAGTYKGLIKCCLLYTSPSPRDRYISRMPSSA